MEEKARICEECGKKIFGRADKRFCNDSCRAAFSNRKYRYENKVVHTIDRILKKNHSILKELISKGVNECSTRELFLKGFNFGYFTSADPLALHVMYCYEIGYQINGERIRIITAL